MTASGCRSCGHEGLVPVLSLGNTPLANRLLSEAELGQSEPHFPLNLAYCGSCSLVQITDIVPPGELFRDYVYFSSFSDTMLDHARELVQRTVHQKKLGTESLVVEIASNDGYLLQFYKSRGIGVLGIEPALNVAEVAISRGIPTLTEFFGAELAERLHAENKRANVVHANNVMAHVPDINGFVSGIHRLLADEGSAFIEVPYVREMISRCEFDTIYHEHVFYFSLHSLSVLFERHDLKVVNVELLPIHGGSLLLEVVRTSASLEVSDTVHQLLAEEVKIGLHTESYYGDFASRVHGLKLELRRVLSELKTAGHRLAAYGAAAKGSTLLNYMEIGRETLDFVVDRSTHKQGKFMPGIHLPILPPAALLEHRPSHVLLLTWNFREEILKQQQAFRQAGGRFIVPVPNVSIV